MYKSSAIFLLSILITVPAFSQTDWVRWGKADYRYAKPDEFRHRDYSYDTENTTNFIAKSFVNTYWFFISDVDGDNCPFRPTCSEFFVESVKETNLFQGTLMFFDRFTRDSNIYKRSQHYPRVKDGHYYDPVTLYTLNEKRIDYISPSVTLNK
jgi:putative component of membrane protein insertase Oxa1/YidC/SpoIIIJ protein YidD